MALENGNRAIFFDLGGTLVALDESRELPIDSHGNIVIRLLPNVAEKLAPTRDALLFVVTNQSKIKRGRMSMPAVEAAIAELDRQLGDILTGYHICPHDDADQCDCRKPKPGMIRELADMFGVDLKNSIMVGDQEIDRQAGTAAGLGGFIWARDFFDWK